MSGRGRYGRARSRSPPRRRDRSRDRQQQQQQRGASAGNRTEEQARLREIMLREAAQRNPDAANVLSGKSSAVDEEAMQRALTQASALGVTHAQNQHFLQQQQQQQQSRFRGSGSYGQGQQQQQHHHQHSQQQRGQQGRSNPFAGSNSEKIFFELHIGGLAETVHDEEALMQFLNQTFTERGLNTEPGNAITSTRINNVGRFAFALFRSKEEATRGLELSGAIYNGNRLRIERPRGYRQQVEQGGGGGANGSLQAPQQQAQPALDEAQTIAAVLASTPAPNLPGFTREQLKRALEENLSRLGDSTSLVELGNLPPNVAREQVEHEAKKYGQVLGVRPVEKTDDSAQSFLVKMASLQDAERLVQLKRMCNGQRVSARFRPLQEWQQQT